MGFSGPSKTTFQNLAHDNKPNNEPYFTHTLGHAAIAGFNLTSTNVKFTNRELPN